MESILTAGLSTLNYERILVSDVNVMQWLPVMTTGTSKNSFGAGANAGQSA